MPTNPSGPPVNPFPPSEPVPAAIPQEPQVVELPGDEDEEEDEIAAYKRKHGMPE